jgi:hypothetical protein
MGTGTRKRLWLGVAGVAAVASLGLAVGWVALSAGSDDDPGPWQPEGTVTVSIPGTPTATATPDLGARPINVGPDLDFPPDTEMLFVLGPWGKDGGPFSVQRVYRIGAGPVQREVLFPPEAVRGDGYAPNTGASVFPTEFAVHPTTKLLFASVCYGDACGLLGTADEFPMRTVFYESRDGGASWQRVLEKEGRWWLRGVHRDQLLAINYDGAEPPGVLLPSGDPFTWPDDLTPWEDGPLYANQSVLYSTPEGDRLVNSTRGVEFRPDIPIDFHLFRAAPLGEKLPVVAAFNETFDEENYDPSRPMPRLRSFVGLFGFEGDVRALYEVPEGAGVSDFTAWLDPTHILGTFSYDSRPSTCTAGGTNSGAVPAVFDTETATLRFIPYPFLDPECPGGSHKVVAVRQGDLARVNTPGDCLNVRELPGRDAPIVTCLPHGAIVQNQGTLWDGRWTDVRLFDSREGYVAVDYLDKGARTRLPAAAVEVLEANLPSSPDRIVGACISFDELPTEGWCYMDVTAEGDTVRLKLGVVASDYVFDVTMRRNEDGAYTLVSIVQIEGG